MKNDLPKIDYRNIYRIFLENYVLRLLLIVILTLSTATISLSQNREIKGIVYDADKQPVPGVNILVSGTTIGTSSDIDGAFVLNVPSGSDELQFSFIGFIDQKVNIGNRSFLEISLKEDISDLEQVIVVGYGVQKKSDITGSVASADTEEMLKFTTNDINRMLVGRVAGVEVNAATGRPGEISSIRIRGTRSLSAGNDPLYIVDGVPLDNIASLNPSDIESLEVLKDASSTAIYGARAANGVVLVTTKRGKEGVTDVRFSTRQNVQQLKRNFDFYSPNGYIDLQREVLRNPDGTYPPNSVVFQPWEIASLENQSFTDWENLTISDALLSRYDLSVSAGTDRAKAMVSLGYYTQDGMIPNSGFEQYNLRINTDYKISKTLSVGSNISYSFSENDREEEFISGYLGLSPLNSPFDSEGNLQPTAGDGNASNPLWNNREYYNTEKIHNYLFNVFSDLKILPNLNYRLNLSANGRFSSSEVYRSSLHQLGSNTNGTGSLGRSQTMDLLMENILNYKMDFGKLGTLDATFVQAANKIRGEFLSVGATQFPTDAFGAAGISGALEPGPPGYSVTERRILSYMGRLNYSLQDKYLLSLTMRADGASVFGANNKWAYLPSVAAGWLVHRENFMNGIDWIPYLKLRGSYGQVGNQGVSPYRTLGVANEYFYKFGLGAPSYSALPSSELFNPNLKWEVSESFNFGVDLGLLDNRLEINAEFYNTNTRDLIVRRTIDSSLGYSSMFDNLGQVRNRGIELTFNYALIRDREFNWNISAMFTRNVNQIISISGELDEDGKPIDDLVNRWFIGRSINNYFDYVFDGIWQNQEQISNGHMPSSQPGDVRVLDINNDGEITGDDRQVYDRDPRFIASFTSQMEYKGFDFSFDFFWRSGGVRANSLYGAGLGSVGSNAMDVGYWTPENPSNALPRPRPNFIPFTSTFQYQDASFFRLRNITLGYTIPANISQKVNIRNVRVYTALMNFWTVTDFLSYGPEHAPGAYPEPRNIEFGLNINF
ncbi:TonB-dependent receptor [Belliella sp. R4-6]|uniref:TonB-dependent receptor n=1 Tax=Belliella alkalica TaxID=1730871 RepID=A0ABS9V7B2_9BACT|nr:TonB-dependent receptor [Belliella alkalica]MCH7412307.1 TonB-dependent receptor [Belliella alkalica]